LSESISGIAHSLTNLKVITLKNPRLSALLAAVAVACLAANAQAHPVEKGTAAPLTHAKVKMERDEFIKTHQWQGEVGWVLKPGMEPPKSRK
jgi:hypothetical protein